MRAGMLARIRSNILDGCYDMTFHAAEEMAEDGLDIIDIENAILSGSIVRKHRDAAGRVCYTIQGNAADAVSFVSVCRPLC